MLEIHKSYLYDENKNAIAVQIPIEEFKRIEETIENYGLSQLIDEVEDEETLTGEEARNYYKLLKTQS